MVVHLCRVLVCASALRCLSYLCGEWCRYLPYVVAAGVVAGLSMFGLPNKLEAVSLPSDVYFVRWANQLSDIADIKSRCSVYK